MISNNVVCIQSTVSNIPADVYYLLYLHFATILGVRNSFKGSMFALLYKVWKSVEDLHADLVHINLLKNKQTKKTGFYNVLEECNVNICPFFNFCT